jgi:hypothetical protein
MSKTLEREIKTIKANLNNDAIPDFAKEPLKKKLAELEEKLRTTGAKEVMKKIEAENKTAPKKESPKSEKKKIVDWDCDDLIEKEKAKLKKRKAAQKKRSSKSEPAKQRERVEKVTTTVEKSIKERIKSGKSVSKKEVMSLIEMYESEINDLKKLLKTL